MSLTSEAWQSPIGKLDIQLNDGCIVAIEIKPNNNKTSASQRASQHASSVVQQQLQAYFAGQQTEFDLPLNMSGTHFQKKVWREMLKIPAGETRSYGDIAKRLKSSARAVGNACRANPIPLIVPCHRVVAKAGLGGFGGETRGRLMSIKRWLLQHEGAAIAQGNG